MSQFEGRDAEFQAVLKGRPFKKCSCGRPVPSGSTQCNECARLSELGFHGKPDQVEDTNVVQSYPSDKDHKGYKSSAPSGKIPGLKERV